MCVWCVCVVIAADATAKRNEHAYNNTRNTATATATRQQQLLEKHERYKYSASTIIISAAQTQLSLVPSPSPSASPLGVHCMCSPIHIDKANMPQNWACNQLAHSLVTLSPSAHQPERSLVTPRRTPAAAAPVATCCCSVLQIISYPSHCPPSLLVSLQQFYQFQCAHKCCRKPPLGARFNAPFQGTRAKAATLLRYCARSTLIGFC